MEGEEMMSVDQITEVRLRNSRGESIRQIAKGCNLSRNTVRKILREGKTEFEREGTKWAETLLTGYQESLEEYLEANETKDRKRRMTVKAIFEELQGKGYEGSYDTVLKHVRAWKAERRTGTRTAYVPLEYKPGEAFQFDWSEEYLSIDGHTTKVYMAHIRLCYSRMPFVMCFPRMTLEMVMEVHVQAHDYFSGLPQKGIYDNLKTVVQDILKGKNRVYNKRFELLYSHYLFEPIACTPRSGWEKGQVEKQVQDLRNTIFNKNCSYASFEHLNNCIKTSINNYTLIHKHPEFDKTIYEAFKEEQAYLCITNQKFEACVLEERIVTKECLVQYDRNYYSVPCEYANKNVTVKIYAFKISIAFEGKEIASHKRMFGRKYYSCDPYHYLPLLKRKPGAIRNGKPFIEWDLSSNIKKIWSKLITIQGGDRQLATILNEIPIHGIELVDEACGESLKNNIITDVFIVNYLNRKSTTKEHTIVTPPEILKIETQPTSDTSIYNIMLGGNTSVTARDSQPA